MNTTPLEPVSNATIDIITQQLTGYSDLWRYIFDSPTGRYSLDRILHEIERYTHYLEKVTPAIRRWAYDYLEQNRGKLWLYEGIHQYHDTPRETLAKTWPFLYAQPRLEYKGFVIDRDEIQREKHRIEERRRTSNPNYKPSQDGYSFWFEDDDDVNQWCDEEREEEQASRNIHINHRLKSRCYEAMLPEVDALQEQWATWEPTRWPYRDKYPPPPSMEGNPYDWLRNHFQYHETCGFRSADSYEDKYLHLFHSIWNMEDYLEKRVESHRMRLKMIREYLEAKAPSPPFSTAPIE